LLAHLPRIEQIIACSPEMCHCGQCGRENKIIGYERTEVLDVEPAKYFVRVLMREKRACPLCEEMGVATAAMPVRIVEKGKLSDAVVVDSLVRKYGEHTPLYRQLIGLEREAGVILSPATFNAGVMRCGELCEPLSGAMREEILGGGYIQADETPVGVRCDLKKGRNHPGPGGTGGVSQRVPRRAANRRLHRLRPGGRKGRHCPCGLHGACPAQIPRGAFDCQKRSAPARSP
jgi:transposase